MTGVPAHRGAATLTSGPFSTDEESVTLRGERLTSEAPWESPTPFEIVPHVQPIVALTAGTVSGYEVLTRFRDSARPVEEIFGAAWADGRGPALEAAAIEAALRLEGRPASTYLAVNVSPRAFTAAAVIRALDVDLDDVVVELTEAHNVPREELRRVAGWLRERGARVAIDDVGTGYAGLERIIDLSPDLIKLDRTLVVALRQDRVSRAMVESLVRFAVRSGAAVCAEGIETQEQLEVVAELDVTFGQGFLFGYPSTSWTRPSAGALAAAVEVHRQVLNATPKQAIFLDDYILLERLADRFSETEELEDVHHAVAGLARLVNSDDVALLVVAPEGGRMVPISHEDWAPVDGGYRLADAPRTQWVLDTRRAVQVFESDTDVGSPEYDRMRAGGYSAVLLVPLTTGGRTIAMLQFLRRRPMPWNLTEIRLARIGASQLAAILDRLLPPAYVPS